MKVAIQGQAGSYHHQAAKQYFGSDVECLFFDTFEQAFSSLENDEADHALIASENSLHGSINRVYDLLLEHDFHITGECYLQIHHQLIAAMDLDISEVSDVYSHPVALEQCRNFIATKLPHAEIHAHADTAGALAEIIEDDSQSTAAIAGKSAQQIYGGNIIAENIETNHENYTRFIALSKQPSTTYEANKTSIILSMPTDRQSGSLYQALGVFAEANINLTKLESRPLVGKAWHYLFYIDLEAVTSDSKLPPALDKLDNLGYTVRILGSY